MRGLVIAAFCSVALAFNAPTRNMWVGRSQGRVSMSNVVDGIKIDGNLTPLGNYVFVKVRKAEDRTSGGILIPDNAKEKPTEGKVIATGPGRTHPDTGILMEMPVKPGQGVVYGKYDGSALKYNDEQHTIIKDDDVLLIFEGETLNLDTAIPCKDHVLVKVPTKETQSTGGLIMSAAAASEQKPDSGVVVKVGKGRQAGNGQFMTPEVKIGDGVRFRDYAGSEIKIGGVEYVVVRVYDILCKW